ncbi:sulfurtransferase complex subunit TusB [Ruegeria marina]|uniref:tRNA 2-thiouridine synthesizing protein B n=1 Tax=Ruegeria marina TaxID=639004 RepID=A0A1G6S7C8_9RHOB|nr:sulfurtransferase complex subunit TusB [Ruegeria marina]SDD12027.1 tRNA 2-thiouridine synthesizing protein B [Ruegeria marina]
MSTLHTVNKSPFGNTALSSCLGHCLTGDAVLLIEDAVYGALDGSAMASEVKARMGEVALYVLEGDLKARGIDAGKLISGAQPVGYDGFVDLVTEHDRTQSWL